MTKTALFVTTLIIIAGIYDLVAIVYGGIEGKGVNYSISRFMQGLPQRATFFVCVCFYILGHFWGFMTPDCEFQKKVLKAMHLEVPLKKMGLRK